MLSMRQLCLDVKKNREVGCAGGGHMTPGVVPQGCVIWRCERVTASLSQPLHPAARRIVASGADLLVALREVAANQRHVERKRLPGRGDRAVVAIYA
jgi:hypothetical protein